MAEISSLGKLFEHLRLQGIAVGQAELRRLEAAFRHEPDLSRRGLVVLLQTVLAKNTAQRRTIERTFQALVPYEQQDTEEDGAGLLNPIGQAGITSVRSRTDILPDTAGQIGNPVKRTKKTPSENLFKQWQRRIKAYFADDPNYWYVGLIATLLLVLPLTWWGLQASHEAEKAPVVVADFDPPPVPKKAIETVQQAPQDLQLADYVTIWSVEKTTLRKIDPLPKLMPPLLLLLAGALGFFWLLHKLRRQAYVRRARPPLIDEDKRGRGFLPALREQPDYHLLSPAQRREIAWGIGRYVSSNPQRQLDIERSVGESARQGLPHIYYRSASREREVWIWQDRGTSNPDLALLAEEISQTLGAVNIPVQRGYFSGLPDEVKNQRGEVLWSLRHEQVERHPLVLVLCDAANFIQYAPDYADRQHRTLRLLGRWPRLCLVDCSQPAGELIRLTQDYALTTLLPRAVAGWLAAQGESAGPLAADGDFCPPDELQRWAIACALPDRPLMEAEIRALHSALGLNCAWQYPQLSRFAKPTGNGFDFTRQRAGLLQDFSWLAQHEDVDCKIALDFWLRRYTDIEAELCARETAQRPWQDSERQRLMELETALLQLWQQPDKAADKLYNLNAHEKLSPQVREKLQRYAFADWPEALADDAEEEAGNHWLRLPQRWGDVEAKTRKQLLNAGFGGIERRVEIGWDRFTGVLLGALSGLMLAGLYFTAQAFWQKTPPTARVHHVLSAPRPPQNQLIKVDSGERLYLGTVKAPPSASADKVEERLDDGYMLDVRWRETGAYPARREVGENTEVWLAGENSRPRRPDNWFTLSLAVIAASPQDKTVQRLAAKLLDSGGVDQVIVGRDWRGYQAELMQQWAGLPGVQWLYVLPEGGEVTGYGEHVVRFTLEPAELLTGLRQSSATPDLLAKADLNGLQDKSVVSGQPEIKAFPKMLDEIQLAHGMTLVRIPAGSFQMGSNNGADDEKPVHAVTIANDFYLSKTEVTFEQYDPSVLAKPLPSDSGWGRGKRPVINVSWEDAQNYLAWLTIDNEYDLECRLPTEAEWEYAARAGSETVYSWGNDIGNNRANCDGCGSEWDNKQTAPVGQFPANAFGVHDMHGNVYEWVQDCWHDNYENAPADGSVWGEANGGQCGRRVLRGGGWLYTPGNLRSANRSWVNPDARSLSLGFRVLCSPPSER